MGKLLGTWQIIDDPSLRFRLRISAGKVIAVKSVKIDIHRRTAVLGSPSQRALYHISFVCQQRIFAISNSDGLYIQIQESLIVLEKYCTLPNTRGCQRQLGIYEGTLAAPPACAPVTLLNQTAITFSETTR